jgi:hypothetical protein
LQKQTGANHRRTVAFTIFYEDSATLNIEWKSSSVNAANYNDLYAKEEFRQPIMDKLYQEFGLPVLSQDP